MNSTGSDIADEEYTGQDYRKVTPYVFIAPAIFVMVAGLAYPVVQLMYLSFYDWKIGTPLDTAESVGWANYARLFSDPDVWESLWVTVRFGASVVEAGCQD